MIFAIHWHESATCIYVPPDPEHPSHVLPHPILLGYPNAPALSALFHVPNLNWSSISHMAIYMFQCCSLKLSPPEKEMATHSNVLAWRIPGKGEPHGLPSMGLHRVGHDWSDLAAAAPSPTESKSLFFTSVTVLLSHIWGHCYHLSKFHIYALINCIDVFISDLLHSV